MTMGVEMEYLAMRGYTIYRLYVGNRATYRVRGWRVAAARVHHDDETHLATDDLAEARASIPRGFIVVERTPDDDPSILETWI